MNNAYSYLSYIILQELGYMYTSVHLQMKFSISILFFTFQKIANISVYEYFVIQDPAQKRTVSVYSCKVVMSLVAFVDNTAPLFYRIQ